MEQQLEGKRSMDKLIARAPNGVHAVVLPQPRYMCDGCGKKGLAHDDHFKCEVSNFFPLVWTTFVAFFASLRLILTLPDIDQECKNFDLCTACASKPDQWPAEPAAAEMSVVSNQEAVSSTAREEERAADSADRPGHLRSHRLHPSHPHVLTYST